MSDKLSIFFKFFDNLSNSTFEKSSINLTNGEITFVAFVISDSITINFSKITFNASI
jgi:hypothetical protein